MNWARISKHVSINWLPSFSKWAIWTKYLKLNNVVFTLQYFLWENAKVLQEKAIFLGERNPFARDWKCFVRKHFLGGKQMLKKANVHLLRNNYFVRECNVLWENAKFPGGMKYFSEPESEWVLLARYVYTYEECFVVTEAPQCKRMTVTGHDAKWQKHNIQYRKLCWRSDKWKFEMKI